MKITIEEMSCSYSVDWSKEDKIEGDFVERYYPSVSEAIETFFRLLENCFSREKIADCLAEGLDAMDYSEKGVRARKLLDTLK